MTTCGCSIKDPDWEPPRLPWYPGMILYCAVHAEAVAMRDVLSRLMGKIDEYEIALPEDAWRSDYSYWADACADARALLVRTQDPRV